MKLRTGYKQTEIGVIPSDWNVKKLRDVASFRTGPFGSALHKSDYTYDSVPVINPMHIIDGQINPSLSMTVSKTIANKLSDFRLSNQEIIIGRRGDMGRCAVVRSQHAGWLCGTGSMIVRPAASVNPEFLQRILSSPEVVSAITDTSVGSTMINLNQGTLSGLSIKFPPLIEQTAIANALSDADALILSLQKLIAKKCQIKQGAMQTLLDPFENGTLKTDWVVKTLGEIAQIGRGRVISHRDIGASISAKYPVYSSQTTNKGIMGYLDTYDFDGEYITWTTDGEKAGTAFYRIGKFNCTNVCGTIKLKRDNALFLTNILLKEMPKYVSRNLANPKIMNDVVKKIEVLIPQDLEEQTRIATILADMDADIAALETKLAKYQQIKQGMMQNLLTGKIRLV